MSFSDVCTYHGWLSRVWTTTDKLKYRKEKTFYWFPNVNSMRFFFLLVVLLNLKSTFFLPKIIYKIHYSFQTYKSSLKFIQVQFLLFGYLIGFSFLSHRNRLESNSEHWNALLLSLRELTEWVIRKDTELTQLRLGPLRGDAASLQKQLVSF